MSTIIDLGLEIRRLVWKDDSFRQAEHQPTVGYGMLGWWDTIVRNAITFQNGTVTTYGALNNFQSLALTNGDELTLPNQMAIVVVEKDFPVGLPHGSIGSIRLRAKNIGVSTTITITLLNSSLAPIFPTYSVTLSSSLYTHYTFSATPSSDVWGIQLYATNGAMIDYVALASCDYINQGGMSFNVSIPKKTEPQTIPNSFDIIQQLGIGSRSNAIMIPKITRSAYDWLENLQVQGIPLELVTPTQQATGYISDLKRHSEAGWVGSPLPSTDSLNVVATAQELYDISFSLIKADSEQNIDTTAPNC